MSIKTYFTKKYISIFTIWLVTISGILGIWLGNKEWFISKTPLNLILGFSLLLWNFPPANGRRSIFIWSLVYCLSMGAELIGVHTGILFGAYHYGENLGLKFFEVPILIGLNWVVLTFVTAYLSQRFIKHKFLALLSGAALMVVLDIFIEPVAPLFDFWHWHTGSAPLRNFIDWFILAFILQFIVTTEIPTKKHSLPLHHFVSQLVFFLFFYAYFLL